VAGSGIEDALIEEIFNHYARSTRICEPSRR
jgi:hypothetical protein